MVQAFQGPQDVVGVTRWRVRCGLPTVRELVRANEFIIVDSSRTIHDSSGFEAENRCVQCLGSAHRIKILPQERDLTVRSSQEDHITIAWRSWSIKLTPR